MGTPILECRRSGFVYQTKRGPIVAIDEANLEIGAGEFVAIVGLSGSGKSTLLAMLAGLCKPTSGEVHFQGQAWGKMSAARVNAARAGKIGLLFQDGGLLPGLTVLDNVLLPVALSGLTEEEAMARARDLLDRVGLGGRWDAYPCELSGGQKRRIGLARALASNPEVILADEPTGDLDPLAAREVTSILAEIRKLCGTSVLVVTHDPVVAAMADRVIQVANGVCFPQKKTEIAFLVQTGHMSNSDRDVPKNLPDLDRQIVFAPNPAGLAKGEPGFGLWPLLQGWMVFLVVTLMAAGMVAFIDRIIARGQRSAVQEARTQRKLAEEMALQDLRADVDDVTMTAQGRVTATLFLQNYNPERPLYLLGPAIEVGSQREGKWNGLEVQMDGNANEIRTVYKEKVTLAVRFTIPSGRHDELFPGYLHLRIGAAMVVSDNPLGGGDLFDRQDAYYFYLRDPRRSDEEIRKVNGWGAKSAVPLWISMPSH